MQEPSKFRSKSSTSLVTLQKIKIFNLNCPNNRHKMQEPSKFRSKSSTLLVTLQKIKIFNLNCPNNSHKSVGDSLIKRAQRLNLKARRNLITMG